MFIGRTDIEAETPIFWSPDVKSWLIWKDWCWERLRAGGEGNDRGWDGWMASLTQWTWVWVDSGSWWWTRRPDILRFMGSQRVRHDWVTELNHNTFIYSSVDGHLGCFHILAIVNNTAMNNGIHVSFQFWFPQVICLRVGFLGHMVVLFPVF